MSSRIIENGNFKRWVRFLLSLLGVALLFGGLRYDSYLVILLGFFIGSIGMYASQAAMLGIKPFSEKSKEISKQKEESSE